MRIQHNIAALNSYRNLTTNNNAVSKNLEKLSSGYRINRAGDDAAGLAISEKMRAQITGLKTAQKNANDGISLVQTAEGALTEVHSMLNRMVELADQAANGTYDDEVSRANLQKEVESLKDEINRISKSTNFNGINLLDGSMEQKTVSSGMTKVTVTAVKDGQLGKTAQAGKFSIDLSNTSFTASADGTDATISIFGHSMTLATGMASGATMTGADAAVKIAEAWNKDGNTIAGVDTRAEVVGNKVVFTMEEAPKTKWTDAKTDNNDAASGGTKGIGADGKKDTNFNAEIGFGNQGEQLAVTVLKEPVDSSEGRKYAQASFDLSKIDIIDGRTLKLGDTTYTFAVGPNSQYKDAANVVDLTDLKSDAKFGKTDTENLSKAAMRLSTAAQNNAQFKVGARTTDGTISLTEKEGGIDYTKYNMVGTSSATYAAKGYNDASGWSDLVKTGKYDATQSQTGLKLQIGDTADSFNQMTVSVMNMNTESLGIADINIGTQAGAADAIAKIKNAINLVSSVRGDLGAIQNRLDHTINNLSVTTENMTAAESRIRDVDMAEEMMAYTKNNILVQASQAMLAQANQIPQGVLQLLQ